MKLLALDTSTEACSVALLINDNVISRFTVQPNQQSKLILPMIEEVFAEAGCVVSSLDAIAFGCGPGSFTGLRIAASVTQGIALAHDLSVIPVSSLQTMAQAAYQEWGYKKILSAIDAHVQALYYGEFIWNDVTFCVENVGKECLLSPQNWVMPEDTSCKRVGTGWRYFDLESHIDYYPKAEAMLQLAIRMFEQKQCFAPELAQPVYFQQEKDLYKTS